MFNKEQVYFLADFLADSLDDIHEEISSYEKMLKLEDVSNDNEIIIEITEYLNESQDTYKNVKELLEVTKNWKRIFT